MAAFRRCTWPFRSSARWRATGMHRGVGVVAGGVGGPDRRVDGLHQAAFRRRCHRRRDRRAWPLTRSSCAGRAAPGRPNAIGQLAPSRALAVVVGYAAAIAIFWIAYRARVGPGVAAKIAYALFRDRATALSSFPRIALAQQPPAPASHRRRRCARRRAPTSCAASTAAIAPTTTCCTTTSTCGSIPRRSGSPARTPSASRCSRTTRASSSSCSTNFTIEQIVHGQAQTLKYTRDLNTVYVDFPETLRAGRTYSIEFHYSGQPREHGRFGALAFKKDPAGGHWINTANEGDGSAVWWPSKDQWRDEPEGTDIRVAVPNGLSTCRTADSSARPISATATRAGTTACTTRSTATTSR